MRLARCSTGLSPPVKYFIDPSGAVRLLWIDCIVSVLFLLCFCARLFVGALWSPAGGGGGGAGLLAIDCGVWL